MFTGNVGVPQNLGLLAEAASLVKDNNDIRFIIVGDGDYLDELKAKVKVLNVENMFIFEGSKPYSSMPLYYNSADCLFASLKNIDLFSKIIPAKIQVYMSTGKPIVCAINGESARIIEDAGCGLTSTAGDPHALADNIMEIYNMQKSKRDEMGARGAEYAAINFNREKLLDKIYGILE